ncbi:hypothetical protein IVB69_10740 [Flavobacterium sp. J49]|nr:hypothetical protein [Flavobacterium sp. J49]MBF6641957.1 hypothetical protein [Flavobacterium sp. J49]NIC03204.1 hypothetical protein [Flavobacterium sp. J49]
MSTFKKQKPTAKKTVANKNSTIADTSNKSPYSKQNIKKKFNEFGDNDSI